MNEDESKAIDAVMVPTLFLGKLKYKPDEIACIVYFESTSNMSEYLRRDEIPKVIKIGIPSHIDLKLVKLVVERFFVRAFDKGVRIFAQTNLIPNEGVTRIWKIMASSYWNTSDTPKERAKEAYKRAAKETKTIAKKDKKNSSLFKELETFLALCVSITGNTPPLSPNVIKQILPER